MTTDTICAIATAQGGAIGIVRISGPKTIQAVSAICTADCNAFDANTVHFTRIVNAAGEVIDEVLVTVFRAPHSYTGEDSVEISCHGSRYILSKVLELLITNGCTLAGPGEFTQRAFMNGKMDLSQAEAVADLIASQNVAQHNVAMTQMRGGITTKLHELHDQLLHLTSLLELELDFSDHEDLEFADRSQLLQLAQSIDTEITHLSGSFAAGNAIKNGIPVAIIGAPNVGKSTLLNALLKDDRAIVSDIQGTTRDLIEDTITINGYLFRFIDTAGIRATSDTIEQMGIERSLKAAQKAQIIISLSAPGTPFIDIDRQDNQHIIYVTNKSDKLTDVTSDKESITISALHQKGLDRLEEALTDIAAAATSQAATDTVIITNERHKQILDIASQDIQRAIAAMHQNLSGDLIAEDLRLCITHLSDILGNTITTEDVLSNIFKHFCVGK
ncbi:MAG: tRNA uridine-5-carboxymethylaminomethyl(34) synthesis GTPase MnmE [Prevotella sp.]|nr:tRNA uridine-5-carboxymethylaminomethyl(34) synthesis GTPase MnmE [Prevotella sp.]